MSMKPQEISPVPEETARVARAANPRGNVYMRMRDELGSMYEDQMLTALFPRRGQPAQAPWRLALVTVMQYMEGLSDRQAAEAVRERIDWKYALSLELTDPGFDFSVLTEFRTRLLAGEAETQLLQALLDLCKSRGWLKARGRQRTDSRHVLAAIRDLNRLECAGETLRRVWVQQCASTTLPCLAPLPWRTEGRAKAADAFDLSLALPDRLAEPEGHVSYGTTKLFLDAYPRIALDKRSSTPRLLLRRVSFVRAVRSVRTDALVG